MERGIIRAAGAEDIDAITAIYRQAVLHGTGTFEIDPPDRGEMAARHERIVAAGYPYLVATRPGGVAGYAYAFAYRDRPAYRYTVEDSVYVAADAQGAGVGGALLNALVAETMAQGFRQMIAVIGDSGNASSIRLHSRAGFRQVGMLEAAGWKFGRWLDVVLMQRSLAEEAEAPPTRSGITPT